MTAIQKINNIMGTKERKARERKFREDMILDAAEKVFFTKGFDNSTMDDVAKTAELSKGSLYNYFNNIYKKEINNLFIYKLRTI